jgi:hypothetical protein
VAKGKAQEGESVMGYFKKKFRENPKWLKERSNHEVLELYRQDHNIGPDDVLSNKVKSGLANAKTLMKKRRRRKRQEAEAAMEPTSAPLKKTVRVSARSTLDTLEMAIDDCMVSAKNLDPEGLNLDPEGLKEVIHILRQARNKVVLMGGEA